MKRKLFSVLLSVAMVATLLVGCGKATDTTKDADKAVVEKEKVFGWAIHYFDEKDLKFDLQTARVSTSNEKPKVQIKKPEKKEKKEKIAKEQLSLF